MLETKDPRAQRPKGPNPMFQPQPCVFFFPFPDPGSLGKRCELEFEEQRDDGLLGEWQVPGHRLPGLRAAQGRRGAGVPGGGGWVGRASREPKACAMVKTAPKVGRDGLINPRKLETMVSPGESMTMTQGVLTHWVFRKVEDRHGWLFHRQQSQTWHVSLSFCWFVRTRKVCFCWA